MPLLVEKARRQIRTLAQWLNLALETPGETQARILYQVITTSFPLPLKGKAKALTALGDGVDSHSRRPEIIQHP